MRALADRERIERLMEAFGRVARRDLRVYLVGGATAVLLGWRPTTIDVDLVTRPEDDALLRAIPGLKEELEINVELASPLDFIPVPHGWEDRGTFIRQAGRVGFFHSTCMPRRWPKSNAVTGKTWRMCGKCSIGGLIERDRALEYFARTEPELYRFPAIDPPSFRRAVEEAFQ